MRKRSQTGRFTFIYFQKKRHTAKSITTLQFLTIIFYQIEIKQIYLTKCHDSINSPNEAIKFLL